MTTWQICGTKKRVSNAGDWRASGGEGGLPTTYVVHPKKRRFNVSLSLWSTGQAKGAARSSDPTTRRLSTRTFIWHSTIHAHTINFYRPLITPEQSTFETQYQRISVTVHCGGRNYHPPCQSSSDSNLSGLDGIRSLPRFTYSNLGSSRAQKM